MRVVITGASGLLGTWLRRTAPPDVDVVSVVHRTPVGGRSVVVDLRQPDAVTAALAATGAQLVVHAAYAKDEASIVSATQNMVAAARAVGADFIHVSSDAVFAGDGTVRDESAAPDPIWDYGRWKARSEAAVTESGGGTVVRLPLIISADPEDHILADIRAAATAGEPKIWFTDEMRQPANAADLAAAIWAIAAMPPGERDGVWHLPGPELLSRLEIARRVVAALGLDPAWIAGAETPPGLPRPRDIRLGCARAVATIGWDPAPVHPPR